MRVAAHYAEAPSAICVDLGAIFVSLLVWTARAALKLSRSDLSLTAGVRYTAVVVFEGGKSVAPEIVSALKQALEARGAEREVTLRTCRTSVCTSPPMKRYSVATFEGNTMPRSRRPM